MRRLVCAIALLWMGGSAGGFGQTVPPESGPPGTRAVQLPLSGRTGQPGGVQTVQNPLPGGLQSVNTITSTVQVQGAYQGSIPSAAAAGPALSLSLDEAVRRGLEYNLGAVSNRNSVRQTRGYQRVERAALLPHLSADLLAVEQQTNLAALGFAGNFPGIPTVVGPFHYFDLRAGVEPERLQPHEPAELSLLVGAVAGDAALGGGYTRPGDAGGGRRLPGGDRRGCAGGCHARPGRHRAGEFPPGAGPPRGRRSASHRLHAQPGGAANPAAAAHVAREQSRQAEDLLRPPHRAARCPGLHAFGQPSLRSPQGAHPRPGAQPRVCEPVRSQSRGGASARGAVRPSGGPGRAAAARRLRGGLRGDRPLSRQFARHVRRYRRCAESRFSKGAVSGAMSSRRTRRLRSGGPSIRTCAEESTPTSARPFWT